MNIFDYSVKDIEEYKKEKDRLVNFLEEEVLIPCMENGFVYKKTLSKEGYDTYTIYLDKKSFFDKKKEIVSFEIIGMTGCINGSRYILECIKGCSIKCELYSSITHFTDNNKEKFKENLGIIFKKFIK